MRGQWGYVDIETDLGLHDTYGVGQIALQDSYNPSYGWGSEYQRQQLNLLRRHQGMPPIAPAPYPRDFFWEGLVLGMRAFIAIYGVWAPLLIFVGPFVAFPAGIAFFAIMTKRRTAKHACAYRRQLQCWIDAGCP